MIWRLSKNIFSLLQNFYKNLCSAHSWLPKHHRLLFKCLCTFNLIFYTKLNTVYWFFFFFGIQKNQRAHQKATSFFICQKQIDNPKLLMLSTYIIDMCTNITEISNIHMYVTHEVTKLVFYKLRSIRLYMRVFQSVGYRWFQKLKIIHMLW